jgi:hypothetical protein
MDMTMTTSTHFYEAACKGRHLLITFGWDAEHNGFTLLVEDDQWDDPLYTNATDEVLQQCGGFAPSLDRYTKILTEFGTPPCEALLNGLRADAAGGELGFHHSYDRAGKLTRRAPRDEDAFV